MDIDKLIKEAMLEKNGSKKEAYRAIKSAILLAQTAKNAKKVDEFQIIRKLIKEREDSISIYEANSRQDLADIERDQLKYLKELLPPEVPIENIENFVKEQYPNGIIQKEMGSAIKLTKEKFPTASGQTVAQIIKSFIK